MEAWTMSHVNHGSHSWHLRSLAFNHPFMWKFGCVHFTMEIHLEGPLELNDYNRNPTKLDSPESWPLRMEELLHLVEPTLHSLTCSPELKPEKNLQFMKDWSEYMVKGADGARG